jgi:hypothetical protein
MKKSQLAKITREAVRKATKRYAIACKPQALSKEATMING